MRAKPHGHARGQPAARITPASSVMVGCLGGLLGTIVMDLFGAGLFLLMGGPASLSFSVIGDAAAGFLALVGIALTGGVSLGALLHYLIGLTFGGIFGLAASRFAVLQLTSLKQAVGFAVLYVEIISQPLLAAAALILQMTGTATAQWFGLSFVMHLVYGLVLGLVAFYGRRDAPADRHR